MSELRQKSKLLTTYLETLLLARHGQPADQKSVSPATENSSRRPHVRIITPSDPEQRGNQLSIWFSVDVGLVFQELAHRGVVVSYVLYCVHLDPNSFNAVFTRMIQSVS